MDENRNQTNSLDQGPSQQRIPRPDTDNDWLFTVRGRQGQLVLEYPLIALEYSWRDRIIDGSMQLGHQELKPDHLTARHV